MRYENENTEFKQKYADDIYKEVIAFANTEGGTIFIEVTDEGKSVGLENVDDTYTRITNGIRDAILPDVTIREDYWDYPKEAVREALLNALIHRDYNFNGSIIINVNEKEMEFISIGGLTGGLSPEDIQNGISLSRNSKLAEIFHRLHFIEAYGTGIRRIFSLYENCLRQPEITVTPNTFKMVLPNMNFAGQKKMKEVKQNQNLTTQMQKVLDYLSEHGEISDQKLQELLNIKRTRAYTLTRQMTEKGLIQISGRGKDKKYFR